MQAYQREKQLGREHAEWLAWCRAFGDWLLTQQQPNGGFPRSWKPGTGEVVGRLAQLQLQRRPAAGAAAPDAPATAATWTPPSAPPISAGRMVSRRAGL